MSTSFSFGFNALFRWLWCASCQTFQKIRDFQALQIRVKFRPSPPSIAARHRPQTMFSSWSPFARSQPEPTPESIELRHGKNTYDISFPPNTLTTTTVADLKSLARQQANLAPENEIKLLFQGKRLDDRETLAKYNIRDGSRVLMTASKKLEKPPAQETLRVPELAPSASTTPKGTPTATATGTPAPMSTLEKIAGIRQGIKKMYGRQVTEFVRSPPASRKERIDMKTRLGELLLQQLMKFDDVIIDPDDFGSKEARLERKAAIKWVQGMMDDVDAVDVDAVE
jgi:BAG domain/Ubiquitin family